MSASFQDLRIETQPALGFLELTSISRGLVLTDAMIKKAPIKIVASQPVSSGKFIVLFFGDVASVEESYREALNLADACVSKNILIPQVHQELVPFLKGIWDWNSERKEASDSIGIIESTTLAGAILSADAALKSADVGLCRMRLGQGIGGKAYFVLTGRLEEVEAATQSAEAALKQLESLTRIDIIARPDEQSLAWF